MKCQKASFISGVRSSKNEEGFFTRVSETQHTWSQREKWVCNKEACCPVRQSVQTMKAPRQFVHLAAKEILSGLIILGSRWNPLQHLDGWQLRRVGLSCPFWKGWFVGSRNWELQGWMILPGCPSRRKRLVQAIPIRASDSIYRSSRQLNSLTYEATG